MPDPARQLAVPGGTVNQGPGVLHGAAVQAGAVYGGVHLHPAGQSAVPVPRQLLAPPRHFVGRERELALLDEAVVGGGIAVLTGPGGVGKTALAMCWGHRARDRFPDGQIYVDLRGFGAAPGQPDGPLDPGAVLAGFLGALGVPRERIPFEVAEQAALFRSTVAGRALLVVLDNAYSAAQVRALLPAAATSGVVVTSRSRLIGLVPDGARLIDVGTLPAPDSVALLARTVGSERIAAEPEPARALATSCGGLPIALTVAAARLAGRPHLSVARVAAELADESGRLRVLSTEEGPSVQVAFDASYRELDQPAAALYRILALHPGTRFGADLVAAVTPLAGADPVGAGIEKLVRASLVEEVAEDRFRFHDLLRLHARQKAETHDSPQRRDLAVLTMLEWYLAAAQRAEHILTPYRKRLPYSPATAPAALPEPVGRSEALAWLEREREQLFAAGRTALDLGYAELSWQIAFVLWPLFLYHQHYRDRLEVDRCGVLAARRWGNRWAEANMRLRLARVTGPVAGDHVTAERETRNAVDLYREVGDAQDILDAQVGLASLLRDTGREEAAIELLTEVLAGNRRMGEPRPTGLTLVRLGMILTHVGRPAEAVPLLAEARQIFAGLADVDPYNGMWATLGLAGALLGAGDLAAARAAAEEAAAGMRELGSELERAEAVTLLGRVAESLGQPGQAVDHYRSALRVFQSLGSPRAAEVRRRLAGCAAAATGTGPPPTNLDGEAG